MTYDARGDLVTVDGPLSGTFDTTRLIYDAARRPVGAIGPDPDGAGPMLQRAARTYYNANGWTTRSDQGTYTGTAPADPTAFYAGFATLQQVSSTYDTAGRLVRSRLTGDAHYWSTTDYEYQDARLLCATVRMNPALLSTAAPACTAQTVDPDYGRDRITRFGYDAAGRAETVVRGWKTGTLPADATTESVTYAPVTGLTASVTDGDGNVSTYAYDGFYRPTRLTYPSAGGGAAATYEQYGYDAASNVVTFIDRAGATTTLTYDALNRLVNADVPSGAADIASAYDNLSRQTGATLATTTPHAVTSTWDALSRLTGQTGRNGTVGFQYDPAGRRTRITWPNATYATYIYNPYGEVTGINQSLSTVLATYGYDDQGRRTSIARANGASTGYTWDAASRLTGLTQNLSGSGQDVSLGFAYNPAGQIVTRTVSNPAYAYTDRNDGVVATPVNGLNQVASEDGTPFAYDGRANLTGDGVRTQTFNPRNQLTAATVPATSLSYDPLGRLYGLSQSGENVRFQYDGLMPIAEYASDDTTLLRRHVPGPGLDEGLLTYEGTGNAAPSWTLADERGSVVGRADNAGVSTRTLTYDEYGVPGVGNGTGAADRFQYTGQVRLPGDLYHYRARAYDPSLGRFLQTDPIGYAAGMNLYAYVGGDPVNWSDPLGLQDTGPSTPLPPVVVTGTPCPQGTRFRERLPDGRSVCQIIGATPVPIGGGVAVGGGSGPGNSGGGSGSGSPTPAQRECEQNVLGPGDTTYRCNAQGRPELTPEARQRACTSYRAVMASNSRLSGYSSYGGFVGAVTNYTPVGAILLAGVAVVTTALGAAQSPDNCSS